MRSRTIVIGVAVIALAAYVAWRFVRPMNIFVVSEAFERPVDTTEVPSPLKTLRAAECGDCHETIYEEWKTTIHSQAWTDPYFQADWKFDGEQQICRNCHTPLDRQQEHRVLGFRDREKWDPILAPNPDFDPGLQHEGVTCAGCHLRDGEIVGVLGLEDKPHPVRRIASANQVCLRCHVVGGERWDTFWRFPPCGTVAEIQAGGDDRRGRSGETVIEDVAALGCVDCHMPAVERPLVDGGPVRPARRHLWRGGHDPDMVRRALDVRLEALPAQRGRTRRFRLTLTNAGAAHYVPTGTPDRHLRVGLRAVDRDGAVLRAEEWLIKRRVLWRPFIVDLWDNRLAPDEPRIYELALDEADLAEAVAVEAVVRYGLVGERRRRRIGYENETPIHYVVFHEQIPLRADLQGAGDE